MIRFRPRFATKLFVFSGIALASVLGLVLASDWWIELSVHSWVYSNVQDVPHNRVGLVLGTSKKLRNGHTNYYFKYRMDAAEALYRAGKIDYILVSGDNGTLSYNEPRDMKKALVARGIPDEAIYLDYAGFRTLDSVIRGLKIFGQKSITIISQEFHNKRAIYIARKHGIKAIGYNARDVNVQDGLKIQLREKLARVLVFIDLYILDTRPKFLGEKIKIG